jgi:hypothetical protein
MQDKVICQVCGQSMREVTWTHLKTHNMTLKDYKLKYPECQVRCIETMIVKSKSAILANADLVRRQTQSEKMSGYKNPFYGRKHTDAVRDVISSNSKATWAKDYDRLCEIRKRCSLSGEKHPNWKGGTVCGSKKHRLRMKALAAYGHRCMIPGCDFTHMVHVHHIVPRVEQGVDELENCILLCPNHHSMADAELFEREYLLSIIEKIRPNLPPFGDPGF